MASGPLCGGYGRVVHDEEGAARLFHDEPCRLDTAAHVDRRVFVAGSQELAPRVEQDGAGIFEPLIGARDDIDGLEAVLDRIRAVWSSAYAPAAVAYRERLNEAPRAVSACVLPCRRLRPSGGRGR